MTPLSLSDLKNVTSLEKLSHVRQETTPKKFTGCNCSKRDWPWESEVFLDHPVRISEFKKKLQKFTVNGRFYVWPWACEDPRWRSRRQRNSSRIPIEIHVGILIWFWSEKNPLCQKIKVLSFLEACLIWSGLPHFPRKFKSWVGKLLKIWGSNPHSGRSNFFVCFFFIFSNS